MGEDSNRRSEPRESDFLHANLRHELVELKVTVRNISPDGAMIQGAGFVRLGAEMSLQLTNIGRVFGKFAWAKDDVCGIRFDHPIDHRQARKPVASANFGRATIFASQPKRSV